MSQIYDGGFLTVLAPGATITTGAASASVTIPNASDGNKPRYIRVAARNECYVRIGAAGVTATASDLLIQPADSAILHVPNGVTTIAAIQGTAAGVVSIVPLENI